VNHVIIIAGLALGMVAQIRGDAGAKPARSEAFMTARGTFNVSVTPQPQDDSAAGPFGRLFMNKQFHGDLQASSQGQMLAAMTAVEGSGAGVAFELVTGTLNGKPGSFILQHKSTMRQGRYFMDVTVVPDSGTGALTGIAGTMTIVVDGGKHSYEFEYTLGR